jgi:hypothetical protein
MPFRSVERAHIVPVRATPKRSTGQVLMQTCLPEVWVLLGNKRRESKSCADKSRESGTPWPLPTGPEEPHSPASPVRLLQYSDEWSGRFLHDHSAGAASNYSDR